MLNDSALTNLLTCTYSNSESDYNERNGLGQGYSIRNPKGPLAKFPFSPGSGTVTVKIQKHNSNKNVRTMHKR